jgi:hypothetical protein
MSTQLTAAKPQWGIGILQCCAHAVVNCVDHYLGRSVSELLICIRAFLHNASLEQDVLDLLAVELGCIVCAKDRRCFASLCKSLEQDLRELVLGGV